MLMVKTGQCTRVHLHFKINFITNIYQVNTYTVGEKISKCLVVRLHHCYDISRLYAQSIDWKLHIHFISVAAAIVSHFFTFILF